MRLFPSLGVQGRALRASKGNFVAALMCPELLDWERALVRDASRGRRLTEKQQAVFERIAAECLEGPNQ